MVPDPPGHNPCLFGGENPLNDLASHETAPVVIRAMGLRGACFAPAVLRPADGVPTPQIAGADVIQAGNPAPQERNALAAA